jgi:hypothetical protein
MGIPGSGALYLGPLIQRGWVLQEWYFARRILYFMPSGMSWLCWEQKTGERYPYDIQQYPGWKWAVEDFSRRDLTYETDRLPAIEGLARALQSMTGDKYHYGVFESRLSSQLLWSTIDRVPASEDLADLPSWSWVSKGGRKHIWCEHDEIVGRYVRPDIEESGTLVITSHAAKCWISARDDAAEDETNGDTTKGRDKGTNEIDGNNDGIEVYAKDITGVDDTQLSDEETNDLLDTIYELFDDHMYYTGSVVRIDTAQGTHKPIGLGVLEKEGFITDVHLLFLGDVAWKVLGWYVPA